MYRWMLRLAGLFAFVIILALAAQTAGADNPPGAKLFATYCAACHGDAGNGSIAPAVGKDKYLSAHDDAAIAKAIADGMPSTGMPAWSKSKGGALTDEQVKDIVAYLRSLATTNVSVPSTLSQPVASTAPAQTKLTVDQTTNADGEVVLNAFLKEYNGTPVSGATIAFSRATSFGIVDLGTAKTGVNGTAMLVLPQVPESAREVTLAFQGDKNLDASATRVVLEPRTIVTTSSGDFNSSAVQLSLDEPLLPPEGSLITPNPPLLPTTLLVLVVGCIWATYGYVVYQLFGIWKDSHKVRENVLRRERT